MKKSDLKNGMYLVTVNGEAFVKIDNNLVGIDCIKFLEEYDDNLRVKGANDLVLDINKIYDGFCTFKEIADKKVKPTWKRKVEIDWNKVPKGTNVKVRVSETATWKSALFLVNTSEFVTTGERFIVAPSGDKREYAEAYSYCQIDESIKSEWLIDEFEECDYENSFKTE